MTFLTLDLPLRTVSEANSSEHWTIKGNRHRQQQFFIRNLLKPIQHQISLPCHVTLTRLATRLLDDDNLVSAFKYIRDEIADILIPLPPGKTTRQKGRADCDPRIKWSYSQEKGPIQSIRIKIASEAKEQPSDILNAIN